jgi:hypothetical protein
MTPHATALPLGARRRTLCAWNDLSRDTNFSAAARATLAAMTTIIDSDQDAAITFRDAPTVVVGGRRYLRDDAARALGDQLAARYATLLERLAGE